MKKSLVALAVLGTFGGAAFAQSSVTLFGVVDASLRYSNNGSTTLQSLAQDGLASSRLGVRGVEDLGGGLRAGFWLEGAINPDTGTAGGQTWQRRSTLSLIGGFGEVRVGRDYTPTFWNLTMFDPFGTNGVGSYSNIHANSPQSGAGANAATLYGATTLVRANNSVGYFLPGNLGGLYGQAMVAAAEGPANGNKYVGARLGYKAGPIDVAASFGQTYVPRANGDETVQNINLGGSFVAGPATVMAQYGQFAFGSNKKQNALIGASAKFGPGIVRASYSIFRDNSAAVDNASQIAAGYIYDLSRRTALYGTVSRISNDGNATTGAGFSTGALAAVKGKEHTGFEVGVRHSF